jgi:hypothetical protein
MKGFVQRHSAFVMGVLNGFDRLRIRGTKRLLASVGGMFRFLWEQGVYLKDFGRYAESVTDQIRRATEQLAEASGRPIQYLANSSTDKESVARRSIPGEPIPPGPVCILSSVEPCWSYEIHRSRESRKLELRRKWRKCLHYYHYVMDPKLGWMHVRLQTWFPFSVHVCVNGREWLARPMDAAGLGYVRRDNCFVHLENVERTQKLMDRQLVTDWTKLLNPLVARINPAERSIFRNHPVEYYWSVDQSEWASDVMFRSSKALSGLYPRLIRHGMQNLSSTDVMRFLGQKIPAHRSPHGKFTGEVVSDLKARAEGMCVRHRVNFNSIKMYNKQGSVLRVETTLNDPSDIKVYRPKEGDPRGAKDWRGLRKGVADLHRRAQVSQAANERYLAALETVEDSTSLAELADRLCRPVSWKGKRARALNPLSPDDAQLLEAVNRGEFAVNGFRNRDLRALLFEGKNVSEKEERRQSSSVTRKLRLLRAHGLIRKVPHTHRYRLTAQGSKTISALLSARAADIAKLLAAA